MFVDGRIDDDALDRLFRKARAVHAWQDRPVTDATIRELYDLVRFCPTSLNTSPARFVFVRTPEGKERLKPHLRPMNVEKTMTAPCCVIVAGDSRFYEFMPQLFPGREFGNLFDDTEMVDDTVQRNTTLQGGYLMLAARALGLDCGPMSGFDRVSLAQDFFPDGRWRVDFLCNIGYGSDEKIFPRLPRLEFEQACREI